MTIKEYYVQIYILDLLSPCLTESAYYYFPKNLDLKFVLFTLHFLVLSNSDSCIQSDK